MNVCSVNTGVKEHAWMNAEMNRANGWGDGWMGWRMDGSRNTSWVIMDAMGAMGAMGVFTLCVHSHSRLLSITAAP